MLRATALIVAVFTAVAFAPNVRAQIAWSTTAATGNMATGSNWVGGTAPATSGNAISFTSSTTTSVNNNISGLSVTGITFNSGSSAFTLSGNAITLAGSVNQNNTSVAQTINTNLILSTNASFGTLNGASLAIGGVISGAFKITKASPGTVTLSAANTYSGGTLINNGTILLTGSGTLGSTTAALSLPQSIGKLDLNGTSQTVGNLSGQGDAAGAIFNNASGTTSTLTIGSGNNGGGTFIGIIADHTSGTGTIALVKTGSASITLSGANTYTGTTTVNAGTLLVNGSLAAGSAVTVASGGKLGGSGTINGATTVSSGGTFAPGNSPGLLTFGSSLTLASGSNSVFEINGTGRGTTYDAVNVAGLMTYGGTFTFNFGTTLPNTTTLNLLNLTGGSTGGLNYVTAIGSYAGNFTNSGGIWSLTTGGQTLTFTESSGNLAIDASAIPEPNTYAALFGVAALALAAHRRRV